MFLFSTAFAEDGAAAPTWFDTAFRKLVSFGLGGWLTIVLLLGVVLGALRVIRLVRKQSDKRFTSGGVAALAIAFACDRVLAWNTPSLDPDALSVLTTVFNLTSALFLGIGIGLLAGDFLSTREGKASVWTARALAIGAMCMALSTVLSRIRLFTMPNGGSVTPASMLPLMLFAYMYGVGPGLLVGMLYGLMDYAFGGWFLSIPQFLLDYPVAFAMIGLAGCFRKSEKLFKTDGERLFFGVLLACVGRYLAAVLAGVVFWAENRTGWEAWSYSLGYNGTYMGIECVICAVLTLVIGPRLIREVHRELADRGRR